MGSRRRYQTTQDDIIVIHPARLGIANWTKASVQVRAMYTVVSHCELKGTNPVEWRASVVETHIEKST